MVKSYPPAAGLVLLASLLVHAAFTAETQDLPGMTAVASSEFSVQSFGDVTFTRRIAARLEAQRRCYLQLFQAPKETGHLGVIIFATKQDYQAYANQQGETRGSDRGGYFPRFKKVLMPWEHQQEAYLLKMLSHEVVHHFNMQIYGVLPPWLDEGLAMYFQETDFAKDNPQLGSVDPATAIRLVKAAKENELKPVAELLKLDFKAFHVAEVDQERLHYDQAWALTHFFVNAAEKLRPDDANAQKRLASYRNHLVFLLNAIRKEKQKPDEAVQKALDELRMEDLEADYRAYLFALAKVTPK